MPGHTNSADPHEHGRPARPKSGSSRKGSTANGVTKPRTNTNTSGSGAPVRKAGKRVSQTIDHQTKTVIKEDKENTLDQKENDKLGKGNMTNEMAESNVNDKVAQESNEDRENDATTVDEVQTIGNTRTRFTRPETPPKVETPPPAPPVQEQPEVFTLEKFNNTVDSFSSVFSSQKFTHVTDDYPADELVHVVSEVTEKIEEYKQQTVSSQRHLEGLREKMYEVRGRLQDNIRQKSNAIRMGKCPFCFF